MTATTAARSHAAPQERIVIARTFDAPRALVWKAWTDPDMLTKWWGPKGCTTKVVAMDLRVGGDFHLEMIVPDGSLHHCRGRFRSIVEPERIVLFGTSVGGSPCGAGLPPQSLVTLTFSEAAGRTTLTMTTELPAALRRESLVAAGFNEGWADSFDALSAVLRGT